MQFNVFNSLKAKLIVAIGAIFTLTISALMVTSYVAQKRSITETARTQLLKDSQSVVEKIDQSTAKAYAMAELVAGMPQVQEALAARDREKLKALTLPFYLSSKERINIYQFQFHLPPATSFLRLHKLDKFGDDLSAIRPTVLQANKTHKAVIGLDNGRFGIGIRGIAPISYQGNHIGTVEFGIALNDALLKPLIDRYGIRAAILVERDNQFKIQAQTGGLKTDPSCTQVFADVLSTSQVGRCLTQENGRHFMILGIPLLDYAGDTEGVVMAKMDYTDQLKAIQKLTLAYLSVGLLIIVLTVGFCYWFIGNYLIRRVKHIKDVLAGASTGDLTRRTKIKAADEMGQLGNDINTFIDNVSDIVEGMQRRSGSLNKIAESLNDVSQNMVTKMQDAASNTATIDSETQRVSDNLNSTSAAVEQTSTNVELIAASAEELSATIRHIVKNTEHASSISQEAVVQSETASALIKALGEAANDIGKVTETIEEISEQTNLLALNATIEAARAGEAGKGFAVVANEIKELARQTAGATRDINTKIEGICSSTNDAVKGIRSIGEIIRSVNDNVGGIVDAVDKQAKTTDEISNSVIQASQGIREVTENVTKNSVAASTIAENMSTLSQATQQIEAESRQISSSAENSVQLAQSMLSSVENYKIR